MTRNLFFRTTSAQKKTPPEGGVLGVEAGFIQARNLSSSEITLRKAAELRKSILSGFGYVKSAKFLWTLMLSVLVAGTATVPAVAQEVDKRHAIAIFGDPALPEGFEHLPYVNPDAPKGGRLTMGEIGTFDSLNPYILKGSAPWPVRVHVVESLMARSYAEPFTLYGLLAETVESPPDRSWVAFTLRPEARFSDGSPVTVEDVIWSFETLGTVGHPRYRTAWKGVSSIKADGERRIRIDFSEPNRELPLLIGLRPVLKKAQFDGVDFASAGQVKLIGSGPYVITDYEPGRFLAFDRDPDWWGKDLPINRGMNNFDEIRYEYFRNADSLWESLKTGNISLFPDYDAARWADGYDFPAIADGTLIRGEIENERPTGMEGFVFNTRRPIFADRRVRKALALTFDWEWINERLFRGSFERVQSFFGGSELGFEEEPTAEEAALLEPWLDDLPDGILDKAWTPPVSKGTGRDRGNLRRANKLLKEAGWVVKDGVLQNAEGRPFGFEIMVNSARDETLASLWADSLKRLGIDVSIRLVDDSQYQSRRTEYDFDMLVNRWGMSLSPGTEQRYYFGSDGAETPGTRNYMGVANPAVDAAIEAILAAESRADFVGAVRALDRVLTHGVYVIPFGTLPADRVVWHKNLARPETDSLYGWWGWWSGPALWWDKTAG